MAEAPWLTIIGLGEDGPDGLSPASAAALAQAEIIMGPPRHLALLGPVDAEARTWPVPFADGLPQLMALRGRPVVVLASGDPFWFGAGTVLTQDLAPGEWRAFPGPSCFALLAARLGWPLERTLCLGLHAAPLTRMRPQMALGARLLVTLRDRAAVADLARQVTDWGFGPSTLTVASALGGPRERLTHGTAEAPPEGAAHPICVALEVGGDGAALSVASGWPDETFDNDGQITKRPIRALTLSALAPRPGERLWDIGSGSGSVAIEWLASHGATQACAIEARADRAARITANAAALGQDRLQVVEGSAPKALIGLPRPDAVFVGGGLSADLIQALTDLCPPGTRIVSNAVTLEGEALLTAAHSRLGGSLMRIALSHAAPLGPKTAWKAAYPIVQWSTVL